MARRVTTAMRKAVEKLQLQRDQIEMKALNDLLATAGERQPGRPRGKKRARARASGSRR
jgi:hypothetical protein